MKNKICTNCKISKPLNEFHKRKNSKDGYDHHCKICGNSRHRDKYKNDLEYQERCKKKNFINLYKLSVDELNELYKINNCEICNKKFESKRLTFIDHNHLTGNVRGLLCPKCNILLGACNDNIEILKFAILYLKKY